MQNWLHSLLLSGVLFMVSACDSSGVLVLVVRSDLTPGQELSRIEVLGAPEALSVDVDRERSWGDGVRVAELRVAHGPGEFEVRAIDIDGQLVVTRPVSVTIQAGEVRITTVLLTRDCRGVTCPPGGDAASIACLGGRCVLPGCSEETPEDCGPPICAADAQCNAGSVPACAQSMCTDSGGCFVSLDHLSCGPGRICDAVGGCVEETVAPLVPGRSRFPWNGFRTGSVATSQTRSASLIAEEIPGAVSYEFQLADSCPETFRDCDFSNPVHTETVAESRITISSGVLPVNASVPVGTRYYWRMRGCNAGGRACGAWSEVRYFDLGRHVTDFDGDGVADLAIGAPGQDARDLNSGAVHVRYGVAAGSLRIGVPEMLDGDDSLSASAAFGASVAAGDFDGDGFADLAVGASNAAASAGAVFIYRGGAAGLSSTPERIDNPGSGTLFGLSLSAAGDLDGDGFDDLVIGTSGENAWVVYGGRAGATSASPGCLDGGATLDGPSLPKRVGDLDGDGLVDVVQGFPDAVAYDGAAYVHWGSGTRWSLGNCAPIGVTLSARVRGTLGFFGNAVVSGDINGDGFGDLVVTQPTGIDTLSVFFGDRDAAVFLASRQDVGHPDGATSVGFGTAVTVGDLNGDGIAEVIASAPGDTVPRVWVFEGRIENDLSAAVALDGPINSGFGMSLGAADLDADGFEDLIVGAGTGGARFEGAVHHYPGRAEPPLAEGEIITGSAAMSRFGEDITP